MAGTNGRRPKNVVIVTLFGRLDSALRQLL
jgi:hypothetical protein